MFSVFKRDKNDRVVPEWAGFFTGHEYGEFLNAIERFFKSKNIPYTLSEDGVINTTADDFGVHAMGLLNVAQVCKQNKTGNYKHIVTDHFATMLRAQAFESEFEKNIEDFEKIKKYIGVRLYHEEHITALGQDLVMHKVFAGDIIAVLVFDLPHSVATIGPEKARKWSKSFDELFELGVQNIRKNYPVKIVPYNWGDFNLLLVNEDHFFAPNIVFDLKRKPELVGSKGSLIGIPHRHTVLIYPIENMGVTNAIHRLIPAIYGMNAEGPGSISNKLFWYKDGQWGDLPYKIEQSNIQFYPAEGFADMLGSLDVEI